MDRRSRLFVAIPVMAMVVKSSSSLAESKDVFNESARNEILGVVKPVEGRVVEEDKEVVLTLPNDRVSSVFAELPTWYEGIFAWGISDPISFAL